MTPGSIERRLTYTWAAYKDKPGKRPEYDRVATYGIPFDSGDMHFERSTVGNSRVVLGELDGYVCIVERL